VDRRTGGGGDGVRSDQTGVSSSGERGIELRWTGSGLGRATWKSEFKRPASRCGEGGWRQGPSQAG
jgi:hypothetical protein